MVEANYDPVSFVAFNASSRCYIIWATPTQSHFWTSKENWNLLEILSDLSSLQRIHLTQHLSTQDFPNPTPLLCPAEGGSPALQAITGWIVVIKVTQQIVISVFQKKLPETSQAHSAVCLQISWTLGTSF